MNVQRIFMISPGEFSCRLAGSWFHKTQNLDPKVPGFEERFSTALASLRLHIMYMQLHGTTCKTML